MSVIRIPIVAWAGGSSLLYKPKIPVSRMKWYSPNTCPLPIPKEKKIRQTWQTEFFRPTIHVFSYISVEVDPCRQWSPVQKIRDCKQSGLNFASISPGPVFSNLGRTWTRKSSRSMDLEHHPTPASKDTGEGNTRFLNRTTSVPSKLKMVAVRPYKPHFQCIFPPGGPGILFTEQTA